MFAAVLILGQGAFAVVYKNNVEASYYANAFHGKKTSNGERFNMNDLTCAHKELPFNTVLKVTNLRNGKSVQVRVNDRGPFIKGREIDLSRAAAVKLDMIKSGTAKVKLEVVKWGPDTKASRQTAQKAMAKMGLKWTNPGPSTVKNVTVKREPGSRWDIQLGAFEVKDNAKQYAQKVLKSGIKGIAIQTAGEVYKVVVKDIAAEDLAKVEQELLNKGYSYTIKPRAIVK